MTLNQLLYFQKTAQLENYRKAADALYISQPSLSRAIASLEEEFGVLLFEKAGRGVQLTRPGKVLLEYATQILDTCQTAEKKMKELSEDGGHVAIGYVFPLAGSFVPEKVREFLDQQGNGRVRMNFWQNHTPAIYQKVKEGELDVGFGGCLEATDMAFYPLLKQELILITPADHPLNTRQAVPLEVLNDYPVIGYDRNSWMGIHTRQLYDSQSLHPEIIVECPDEYSIVSLVRQRFGIALVPRTDLLKEEAGFVIHPLEGTPYYHQVYMFWDKNRYHLPAVNRFIEFMKKVGDKEEDFAGIPLKDF